MMIVILAFVAAFLALRLYSVLGKRTGHEQQPAPIEATERKQVTPVQMRPQPAQSGEPLRFANSLIAPEAESGLRALIAADRGFDLTKFVDGAKAAYGMILEAFWKGKKDDLHWLCDTDVATAFETAIAEREALGHVLDNRLVRIDNVRIVDASLTGRVAHVTIQFDSDIAAITRDGEGNIVAGSLTDAESLRDVWTFSRDLSSRDPNWKLSETDEAA